MKLKTLDTMDDLEFLPAHKAQVKDRFDTVCNLDPVMLLKLCLAMPEGDDTSGFRRERNHVASTLDRRGLFTEAGAAVSTLVMPYVEFLMAKYEEDQVDDVEAALTMFVSVDLAERSEWSPAYLAAVEKIEEALGF